MNRLTLLLILVLIGLSAQANYTVQTYQPVYPSHGYYQTPFQFPQQYVNPYTYQQQCSTPYMYQRQYPLMNPPGLNANTGGTQGIVKNIGQSILYSMMGGY